MSGSGWESIGGIVWPADLESGDSLISGPHRVAAGDGAGGMLLSPHGDPASERVVRTRQPDPSQRRVRPRKHCRGSWTAEPQGLPSLPVDRAGITLRAPDPANAGFQTTSDRHSTRRRARRPNSTNAEHSDKAPTPHPESL